MNNFVYHDKFMFAVRHEGTHCFNTYVIYQSSSYRNRTMTLKFYETPKVYLDALLIAKMFSEHK